MKEKILIFKNDRLGDLIHSVDAINQICLENPNNEVVLFLSKISKSFFFLFQNNNTQLKVTNYHLTLVEKIKIFFYISTKKIKDIYILSPKTYYFLLPIFFKKIRFFGLCVNKLNGYRRPNLFLRKFLYKFVINDRETKGKRLSIRKLQLKLCTDKNYKNENFDLNLNLPISSQLNKYLPKNKFALIHYKKKIYDRLNWRLDDLYLIIDEIKKYFNYVVLIKDIENDETNIILRNKFSTFDFKTNIHYIKNGNVIFLDNIIGEDLYNVIKFSQKVIATHGTIPSIASMFRKPCLDLFDCEINNIEDYRRMKNAFHEFKPSYPAYDFIIPRKNINKTINKMIFSLKKVTENA